MFNEKTVTCQCIHPFHAGLISKLKYSILRWQLQQIITNAVETDGDSGLIDSALYILEHVEELRA